MNDVIVKPVSAGTVERKLRSLLLAPKAFVTTKEFVGPDRRHEDEGRCIFGKRRPSLDRRRSSAEISVFSVLPRIDPERTR